MDFLNRNFSFLIAGLSLTLLFTLKSQASLSGCTFVSRQSVKSEMSALTPEIIGWVSCAERNPEASQIFVARMAQLDESALQKFAGVYAHQMDHTASLAKIAWVSTSEFEKRQIVVTTTTPAHAGIPASVMSHYLFVAPEQNGSYLVYAHSMLEPSAHAVRNTLQMLRDKLVNPQAVAELAAQ